MPDFTRRTHIVRVGQPGDNPGDPPSDSVYVDIEVLDAISFRTENGDEVILNMKPSNSAPYIVDETGGDHGKTPSDPTQRTIMKRIVGKTDTKQMLDIEVSSVVAFQDQNGGEWILDMSKTNGDPSVFDTTDGTGDNSATRRVHQEKITIPYGSKDAGVPFLTVERCDSIAFRTIMGQEVIVKCPSNDDGNGPRASTFTTPEGYDPGNDDGPKPPANTDGHNYVAFVKDASGIATDKARLSMGPFWWIRKISQGGGTILITVEYNVAKDSPGQPSEPKITLTNMPFDTNAVFQVEGDIYKQITEGGERIAIVNPLSAGMGGLYQWSYPPYIEKKNTNGNSNILYYVGGGGITVNEGNFDQTYPGGTDQCGNRVVYSTVISSFWNCNLPAVGEAVGNGFTQTGLYVGRGSWDIQADAQYSADALNSLHFFQSAGIVAVVGSVTLTPSAGANTILRRDVMGFNLSALKAKAPKGDEFTFEIDVPVSPDVSGDMVIKGAAYTSKTKDFPLDSKNVPQTEGWPQDTVTNSSGGVGKITVHVNTSDPKNPFVFFTSDFSGGVPEG